MVILEELDQGVLQVYRGQEDSQDPMALKETKVREEQMVSMVVRVTLVCQDLLEQLEPLVLGVQVEQLEQMEEGVKLVLQEDKASLDFRDLRETGETLETLD